MPESSWQIVVLAVSWSPAPQATRALGMAGILLESAGCGASVLAIKKPVMN